MRVWNDDYRAKAQRISDDCKSDARVAGRAFDDHSARLQGTAADGIANDEERSAVLDRLAGIHEFGLTENFATGDIAGTIETDQRRVPDRVNHVFFYVHCPELLKGQVNLMGPKRCFKAQKGSWRPPNFLKRAAMRSALAPG